MQSRILTAVILSVIFALVASAVIAQTASTHAKTRPANILAGTLGAVDTTAATIVIKPKTGAEKLFRLTEKSQMWRAKKTAEVSEFKTGDSVVARFRKSAVGPATLYDLADAVSWSWIDRMRHETTAVIVKEIDDENLHAKEGADAAEFSYRLSEKTQWTKGGKPAAPSDFKPGNKVYVVPRMLPGGVTMAVGVSDESNEAAKLKERGKLVLSGMIRTLNAEKRTLSLHTPAGDDRDFTLTAECVIRSSGKDVPFSYLRLGQSVTLHLTRDDAGEQVVKQVTIKGKTTKRLPGKPGMNKKPAN